MPSMIGTRVFVSLDSQDLLFDVARACSVPCRHSWRHSSADNPICARRAVPPSPRPRLVNCKRKPLGKSPFAEPANLRGSLVSPEAQGAGGKPIRGRSLGGADGSSISTSNHSQAPPASQSGNPTTCRQLTHRVLIGERSDVARGAAVPRWGSSPTVRTFYIPSPAFRAREVERSSSKPATPLRRHCHAKAAFTRFGVIWPVVLRLVARNDTRGRQPVSTGFLLPVLPKGDLTLRYHCHTALDLSHGQSLMRTRRSQGGTEWKRVRDDERGLPSAPLSG